MSKYPKNWRQIAIDVKAEAGGHCIRCGHVHDPQGFYVLTVHHLDGDKTNCEWWNLAALCQRCHLRIQGRVNVRQGFLFPELHSDWLLPLLKGFAEAECPNAADMFHNDQRLKSPAHGSECSLCEGRGWIPGPPAEGTRLPPWLRPQRYRRRPIPS